MSTHSKFYVPFLIAGMIFTARSNPIPSSSQTLTPPHRAPAIRYGPNTRTCNASRIATRTTLCSTSNLSGRPSRCSARPLSSLQHILVSNHPRAAAGEMLCKYHRALVHNSRLICSSSQFKASYPSFTPSFDHSPSRSLNNLKMSTLLTSCSLSLAGAALSFGFPPYAI